MSPRRAVTPQDRPLYVETAARPRGWWRVPLWVSAAAVFLITAVSICGLILVSHETQRRRAIATATVLDEVRSFMTMYTARDPFHANDYVDAVLARSTGDFAEQYQREANTILLNVARGQPTTGTVLDAGLERWRDDGSATVLVVTDIRSTTPDGKAPIHIAYRCLVTATMEGGQWKISDLVQVI